MADIMRKTPKGVQALFFDVAKVGKRIKASKKKYSWKFTIDSREHTVDMYVSNLSGKRKVLVDGDLRFNGKATSGVYFQFPIKIDHAMIVIEQNEEMWDLKIGGVSFTHLLASRQGNFETDSAWSAVQKDQAISEFGKVHNKWDDWGDSPKEKPTDPWGGKSAPKDSDPWSRQDQGDDEEAWEQPKDTWEKPGWNAKPKPASRPAPDSPWEARGFPEQDDEPPRRPREDPRYRTSVREEEPRYKGPREDEQRYRGQRDDDPRYRGPRGEEPRYKGTRGEDPRYRTSVREEEPRPPRRNPEPEEDYEYREPRQQGKPSPTQTRQPPREEYERPKPQNFDPFEINDTPPQPKKQTYDRQDEELYPSLASIESKPFPQSYPYQAPPAASAPVQSDPFGGQMSFPTAAQQPTAFAPVSAPTQSANPMLAANVFESKPAASFSPPEFEVKSSKPFEGDLFGAQSNPAPVSRPPPGADLAGLVDLDGLGLGDEYSPAVMKKREEQNRAVTIGIQAPNVPMNQLKPDQRAMQTMPQPMMPNPMAAAMMMQTYMTGMMMNQMMMNQGNQQPRYF